MHTARLLTASRSISCISGQGSAQASGCRPSPWMQTPPYSQTPLDADTPWKQTHLEVDPLKADPPYRQTPPCRQTPRCRPPGCRPPGCRPPGCRPLDADPLDADPRCRSPLDADLLDADPRCRSPLDADLLDADPLDADPLDADLLDAGPLWMQTFWMQTPWMQTPWSCNLWCMLSEPPWLPPPDHRVDRQTYVKTLPSPETSFAGGNYLLEKHFVGLLISNWKLTLQIQSQSRHLPQIYRL